MSNSIARVKHRQTAAFNVERARDLLLADVKVPRNLVSLALKRAKQGLDAMETKFFARNGEVVETKNVINWTARQKAADQIFSMAGLYLRESEKKPATPSVAIEVDPITGVVKLVVLQGDALAMAQAPIDSADVVEIDGEEVIDSEDLNNGELTLGAFHSDEDGSVVGGLSVPGDIPTTFHKVPRMGSREIDDVTKAILFGKEPDD